MIKDYFRSLAQKITTQRLTEIVFKELNDLFVPDLEKAVYCNGRNKHGSGFNYRLKFSKEIDSSSNKQLYANMNLLNLVPLKVKPFYGVCN